MPPPHRVQMQMIRRRLVGREGAERVRELRAILGELPNYRNGPYADIRKWVLGEVDATRFDLAARVDGRVAEIPVERGQNIDAIVAGVGRARDRPAEHRRVRTRVSRSRSRPRRRAS